MRPTEYIYEQECADERRRLDALGSLYDPWSTSRLATIGLAAGWRCWEVGGGSGTVARFLCERVGADGQVSARGMTLMAP